MGILGSLKFYVFGAIFLVAAGVAVAGFVYVKDIIAENKALAQEVDMLISSNDSLQTALDNTLADQERQSQLNSELQVKLSESEQRLTVLRRLFLDHDLTNLALEKPGLIERRINSATKDVFDNIESDTAR